MSAAEGTTVIESKSQFKDTPEGQADRWTVELAAAQDQMKTWKEQAKAANRRYLGEAGTSATLKDTLKSRLNLYHANVNIICTVLFGQVPKVDVSRRFQDANDEDARVASEALERHLNTDIEDGADDFQHEVKDAIQDWKITGLGQTRLRYEAEFEDVAETPAKVDDAGKERAPAVAAHQEKSLEDVKTDFVYWDDFLWSPVRRWKDVRWVAFRAEMTRDQAIKRFGEDIGRNIPMVAKKLRDDTEVNEKLKEVWQRAQVWEVWSKEDRKVYWVVSGFNRVLDVKDDPLGLKGFFPCPRPLVSNTTTTLFLPKPDLEIDKALYDEIDELANRLRYLVKMCKLSGAYDKAFPDLVRILEEAGEGQLVPVSGWAGMAEKGGVMASVQFLPIKDIASVVDVLTGKLAEKIQLLYQVTGLSDVMRGDTLKKKTATEVRAETGFTSTRLQTDQDEVARFATDLQRLRAEIISKLFDAQTIIERSNLLQVETIDVPPQMPGQSPTKQPNMPVIQKAVELIKNRIWEYRIEIKADSIALRDYAALKSERMEAVTSLAALFQQAVPMVQLVPQAGPTLIELCKWVIAATKGSQQMEAIFDKLAAQIEAAASAPKPPPPPDPKLMAAQVKAQAESQKAKMGVVQTMVDAKAHLAKTQADMQANAAEHDQKMAQIAIKAAIPPPATGAPNA